ncbi:50S ribosomal protein L15 [Candidatus Dependentiae bacterium Noda2021]|nr:50S ribosomal protein L15 [Candidatus Dependentiae bacterium Noda2021]
MLALNNLSSAGKKRKRIGRGGERGGTSGRGGKGQTARSGGSTRPGFEGGQTPLYRRLPKRGFNNFEFQKTIVTVNIDTLDKAFDNGAVVDANVLLEKGLIKVRKCLQGTNKRFFVKILGNGSLTKNITVMADAFSESAKKAIENSGGQVRLTKEM